MSPLVKKRIAAVKTADAINAIEGAPISSYARSHTSQLGPRRTDGRADETGIAGTSSPDRGAGAPEPCLTRTCMKMCLF